MKKETRIQSALSVFMSEIYLSFQRSVKILNFSGLTKIIQFLNYCKMIYCLEEYSMYEFLKVYVIFDFTIQWINRLISLLTIQLWTNELLLLQK